jgi:hypothetical protein
MIKKLFLLGGLFLVSIEAQMIQDQDFDGVPDSIDKCQDTPFLHEVDKQGCTTMILTLPFETESESLIMSLGYGYSTNEDLIDREIQHNTKLKVGYYLDNWGYTIQTGYYKHNIHKGMIDTLVRVQKRIKINSEFVMSIGTGLRLPSYDFEGNKLDAMLYTSLHYYPTSSLSIVAGYNYTYIGDDEVETVLSETAEGDEDDEEESDIYEGLQNKHNFYIGVGYFITDKLYLNLLYSDESSKFVSEHNIRTVSSSLYYKINKKWFTTLYYKREVLDEDLHDNLNLTVGYHIW